MKCRFYIIDGFEYEVFATDDEEIAQECAEDAQYVVIDTVTDKWLREDGDIEDIEEITGIEDW